MKPYYLLGSNGRVCYFLLLSLFLGIAQVEAQVGNGKIALGKPLTSNQANVRPVNGDTLVFHRLSKRFQAEVSKKGSADLDSIRFYSQAITTIYKQQHLVHELIETYIGLGRIYLDKNVLDSSIYYFKTAIKESKSLRDTSLLTSALLSYGWSQMWDPATYDEGELNVSTARDLAKMVKDTSTYLSASSKLAQIYYYISDYLKAFDISIKINEIATQRKDTFALIENYYSLESIYSDLNLHEKQMEMVHKALAISPFIKDTSKLFLIYRTASRGYLITHQYDSAIYYARLNLPIATYLHKMPLGYTHIARSYLETNQLDSARYYYDKIYQELLLENLHIESDLYLDLGKIEFKSGNLDNAIAYYKKAESMIDRSPLSSQMDIYKALSTYYQSKNEYEEAYTYLSHYELIADSINTFQIGISVLEYESAEDKNQNLILRSGMEYQAVLVSKQRQEKQIVYGSTVVLLIMLGFGFYRFRKYQNLKSKESLTNERLRISGELHDEVGATLSGIAMYSHVAVEQLKGSNSKEVEHSLIFMQKSAGEMVNKLSDIVWLLNPEQDTIMELFGRLGEYGKQMTRLRDMQIRIDLPADLASKYLPLEARRNIYLFCKEAINNAVKYSNGRLLILQVKSTGHQMVFSVTDDGNGFDASIVRQGNGLVNMQKRAQDIGAVFHLDTKVNQGTRMELQYKIIQ